MATAVAASPLARSASATPRATPWSPQPTSATGKKAAETSALNSTPLITSPQSTRRSGMPTEKPRISTVWVWMPMAADM